MPWSSRATARRWRAPRTTAPSGSGTWRPDGRRTRSGWTQPPPPHLFHHLETPPRKPTFPGVPLAGETFGPYASFLKFAADGVSLLVAVRGWEEPDGEVRVWDGATGKER